MMISGKETLGLLLTMRINQNNVFLALFLSLIMNFTHAIDSGLAFNALIPARDAKPRHGAILMPFDAVIGCLEKVSVK